MVDQYIIFFFVKRCDLDIPTDMELKPRLAMLSVGEWLINENYSQTSQKQLSKLTSTI